METDAYITLTREGNGIYREKGSRFLARASPADREDMIQQALEALKKEHPKARHICYAWRLNSSGETREKTYDDHEPPGTAGLPILNRIRSAGIENVLVAVVRYFGGTLLGTAGLIHAYGAAAGEALEDGGRVEKYREKKFHVSCPYACTDKVYRIAARFSGRVAIKSSDLDCTFVIYIRAMQAEKFTEKIRQEGYRIEMLPE